MNRDSILKIANIFLDYSDSEDKELVSIAQSQGLSLEQAERAVAFLPIAFGRVVIQSLGNVKFSNNFHIKGSPIKHALSGEPVFAQALDIAKESLAAGLVSRECFSAIATRSPELGAVNKALNAGEDLNGAEMGPVLLFGYETIGKKQGWFRSLFG